MKRKTLWSMRAAATAAAAGIILIYLSASAGQMDRASYGKGLLLYAAAGFLLVSGLRSLQRGKRDVGVGACMGAVLVPVLLIPVLAGGEGVPYLLQVTRGAWRMILMFCPCLAFLLLKALQNASDKRKYGWLWMSAIYYAVLFGAAAVLQSILKAQWQSLQGYLVTWNAAETICWAMEVNVVFLRFAGRGGPCETRRKWTGPRRFAIVFVSNAAALAVAAARSRHMKRILSEFVTLLVRSGPVTALRLNTWLSYRRMILKGVLFGEYTPGIGIRVENFPDERFVFISWTSEPMVSLRLTRGWSAVLVLLVLFTVLVAALFRIRSGDRKADAFAWCGKFSFAAAGGLSFLFQLFLPAQELMTPLLGDGACMMILFVALLGPPPVMPQKIPEEKAGPPAGSASEERAHLQNDPEQYNTFMTRRKIECQTK